MLTLPCGVLTFVNYQSKTIENVGCIHWLLPGFYARDTSVVPAVIDPSAGSRWQKIVDKLTTAAKNVFFDIKSSRLAAGGAASSSQKPGISFVIYSQFYVIINII
jgi:hypothetical protein